MEGEKINIAQVKEEQFLEGGEPLIVNIDE